MECQKGAVKKAAKNKRNTAKLTHEKRIALKCGEVPGKSTSFRRFQSGIFGGNATRRKHMMKL